jgi:hypothetical protein
MITAIPIVNYEASSDSDGDVSSSYIFVIEEVIHSPSVSFFFPSWLFYNIVSTETIYHRMIGEC